VDDLEGDASRVRVRLRAPAGLVAEVTPAAVGELGLAPGASVYATVKATDVAVYPA
jgi:molybdate transport system ATP-binding protein